MNDDSASDPASALDACRTGSGFYVPGTHDVACDDEGAGAPATPPPLPGP
jgi:hypothetical protein